MKIYFLVATQHDNLGDLLINRMLIEEISKYGVVYVDAAGVKPSFKKKLIFGGNKDFELEYGGSLKRVSGFKLLSVVREKFDFYFKSPGPSGGFSMDIKSVIRTFAMAFQYTYLHKGGLCLNLIGNDILIKNKFDKWFQNITNKTFDNYLVRSKGNRDELLGLGFNNIGFIPDVGFLYDKSKRKVKDKVCISFRDLKDFDYNNRIILLLKEMIPHYINQGLKVFFFYQVESDYDYNLLLYKQFERLGVFFKKKCLKYDEIEYYDNAKFLVSNRLHVMILGLVHNCLPLLILNDDSKTTKINRILSDNNLNNLIIKNSQDFLDLDLKKNILAIETIVIDNRQLIVDSVNKVFNQRL